MTSSSLFSSTVRRLAPALLVIGAACGGDADAADAPAPASPDSITLAADDIAVVESRTLTSGPILSGTLVPRVQAVIRAQVGGAVTMTFVERGVRVAAGAPLARINDRTQIAAYASALAAVKNAENAFIMAERRAERLQRLLASGAVSAESTEDARQAVVGAESLLAAARASLAQTNEDLAHATIRAPFAGIVSVRSINIGDIVQPGDPAFEVLDPSSMRLDGAVPAAQLPAVRVGALVSFHVAGYPGRTFTGRIDRVSPAADVATRQVPVTVAIANQNGELVSGLFAEGQLTASSRSALVAPATSLDSAGGTPFVLRLKDGRIAKVAVRAGDRRPDEGILELIGDVVEGDTILVSRFRGVSAGAPARVVVPTPSPITR
jgi:RND family efflux transporter MFP subunit